MLESWYALTGVLLPFQWAEHNFMKNALLAVLLIMPLFGLLGTMVVNNRMAFFSDSLGHGAFTGVAFGMLLGFKEPMSAIIAFSLVFACLITLIKFKSTASTDTIIGVFSSLAVAIGLVLLSRGGSFAQYSGYLIGDLLSINATDLFMAAGAFVLIIFLWLGIFNRLLLTSINASLAASRNVKALAVDMLFAGALAVVVAISIQWVGVLLINSMLVLPAAAARNVSSNMRQYHLWSVGIALFAGVSGLIASYYVNIASGATIILAAGIVFFVTLFMRKR